MYNRYVPQPDGSFRRNRIEEPRHKATAKPKNHCEKANPCNAPPEAPPCLPPITETSHPSRCSSHQESAGGFLQNLLPKNLDTGDLIVILLLLLLAGDCEEDRSNALLTLALYLFM